MDMIFNEILQINCYAVPELPPARNPSHNCIVIQIQKRHWLTIISNHFKALHEIVKPLFLSKRLYRYSMCARQIGINP